MDWGNVKKCWQNHRLAFLSSRATLVRETCHQGTGVGGCLSGMSGFDKCTCGIEPTALTSAVVVRVYTRINTLVVLTQHFLHLFLWEPSLHRDVRIWQMYSWYWPHILLACMGWIPDKDKDKDIGAKTFFWVYKTYVHVLSYKLLTTVTDSEWKANFTIFQLNLKLVTNRQSKCYNSFLKLARDDQNIETLGRKKAVCMCSLAYDVVQTVEVEHFTMHHIWL